ncbi:hypothetical protein CJ030_MR3G001281 [Morella rubra]|uniref:Uncharacterized protein n=1 Tax=Morella rubra TaxID=262757 RepID=A0A6A1W4I9_9ROSI|nr:hypothetical protein CJ030_MR3G001281 [Morella rubra]
MYPERNLPSLPRTKLLEIYRKIGVRTISESVEREKASVVDIAKLNQVNLKEILIKKGLVRLILGFLADPMMKMEAERRHEAVRGLLDMKILATNEPLHINYSLSLTSREIVKVKSCRTIRWNREASKFFAVKLDRFCGYKNIIGEDVGRWRVTREEGGKRMTLGIKEAVGEGDFEINKHLGWQP